MTIIQEYQKIFVSYQKQQLRIPRAWGLSIVEFPKAKVVKIFAPPTIGYRYFLISLNDKIVDKTR